MRIYKGEGFIKHLFAVKNPLKLLNFTTLLQQQKYIVPISYLFYISNGLTLSDFLLFQSIYYFTGLIAEIPAGYIGDIFPRKNILILSYVLFICRILMWIIIPNYHTILLGEILFGLSKAFFRGVSDGYIYDYLKTYNATELMLNKYGKFNFFVSAGTAISCLIGAWLYKYLGFRILLGIELICNSTALFILFFLPNIPQNKKAVSFIQHFSKIFDIIKSSAKNTKINFHMIYSGILSGITSVFVWNFQPLMKSYALPASLFGVIYFINHILRAIGSMYADKFMKIFSLSKTGWLVWILYIFCFIIMIKATELKYIPICIVTLVFVCIAIGIQMIFNVGNLSRIHSLISSNSRATISSVNSMLSSLFSGLFLMMFRHLANNGTIASALIIFVCIFFFSFFIIRQISKRSA